MTYTAPNALTLAADWTGLGGYAAPTASAVHGSWYVMGQGSPLGDPSVVLFGDIVAVMTVPSIMRPPQITAGQVIATRLQTAGPLGSPVVRVFHDWTQTIGDTVQTFYECEITGIPPVRVPISSWQATIQTGRKSYTQAVIPAAGDYVGTLTARPLEEFVIYKIARYADGNVIEQEMARAPMGDVRVDQGALRQTATLSGYTDYVPDDPGVTERTLTGLRSVSQYGSLLRVRTDIDWLLRPGMTALAGGRALNVAYINYYVSGNQAYMDVGERAE